MADGERERRMQQHLARARESWFDVGRRSERRDIVRMLQRLAKHPHYENHRLVVLALAARVRERSQRRGSGRGR